MLKKYLFVFVLAFTTLTSVRADEGMWLPILIEKNMATMTELGFKLTASDIYNINQACIKDAIVALDGGSCTASFVSPEGLMMTNHHCGYGEIQSHSTVENDLLTNGFFARSKKEELANPGKTAWILVSVADVTERVLDSTENMTIAERDEHIAKVKSQLVDENSNESKYTVEVESMYYGNQYYMFVYEVFKDVRLVAAPPESIGKFGADTDNWMWPRHTGDFSMFRVYCAPDGSAAEYSEDNVPYKPKHFLPISLKGYKENDFAFVMGYPGSTSRYITAAETQFTTDVTNSIRIKVRGAKQDIWKKYMNNDDQIRIQYASKYARSSNYWKYSIGQNRGLARLGVVEKKKAIEKEYLDWCKQDPDRNKKYGNALSVIDDYFNTIAKDAEAYNYIYETFFAGAEIIRFALQAKSLYDMLLLQDSDPEDIVKKRDKLITTANSFYKDYNVDVDRHTTKEMIKLFMGSVDEKFYPEFIVKEVKGKYKGNVDKYVDDMFAKSLFANKEKLEQKISTLKATDLAKDMAFVASCSAYDTYLSCIERAEVDELKFHEGMRLFVDGIMQMNPDKLFASDANSTMRLTYGTIYGYKPADAVWYDFKTTLDGVMEKENPNEREFNVPAKLKEIYYTKNYGEYGNPDGTMTVCFTTNNDITGGNSGSPVINAEGQLIGLAFDGNWEAMSGDIAFETELQKCIAVDIRYVLLILDKMAGAQNLIDEMTFVRN